MAASFDPFDRQSWFFGEMNREDATNILNNGHEIGSFLVRNSCSKPGDLVLSVKENSKVNHYIINKVITPNGLQFRMGDQYFYDIPNLLSFFRMHQLDTTLLKRPANKPPERVKAIYEFEGRDADDLPFRRNEILTIISKDEEQWWTAKNCYGQTGSIPVNYVERIDSGTHSMNDFGMDAPAVRRPNELMHVMPSQNEMEQPKPQYNTPHIQRSLPAYAKVKQAKVPNAYDDSELKLEVGDIIKVTEIRLDGLWIGELKGKIGLFPFNHIEFMEPENGEQDGHPS